MIAGEFMPRYQSVGSRTDGHVLHVGRDTHVRDLDSVATAGDLDESRIDGEGLSVKTSRSGEL